MATREGTNRAGTSGGSSAMKWLLVALAIVVLAIIAFFAFGGDVATDTEGEADVDVQTPETDVDVEGPDVDAEAPDVDVEGGDLDVEEGDAEADASN